MKEIDHSFPATHLPAADMRCRLQYSTVVRTTHRSVTAAQPHSQSHPETQCFGLDFSRTGQCSAGQENWRTNFLWRPSTGPAPYKLLPVPGCRQTTIPFTSDRLGSSNQRIRMIGSVFLWGLLKIWRFPVDCVFLVGLQVE